MRPRITMRCAEHMSTTAQQSSGDPRLTPFLDAGSEHDATAALAQLVGGEIDRVVRDAVRRELSGSSVGATHIDDVVADVRVRLIRKLWSLRRHQDEPIENFAAYAATAAAHGCHSFLRCQYPERTRFRNRVRYAVA